MPPKKSGSAKKKTVSKDDSEDFQAFLAELSKATKQHGKELEKERSKEEAVKKKNEEKRVAIAKKTSTNDVEAFLERQQQQKQLQALFQQMMSQNRPFLSQPKTDFTGETFSVEGSLDIAVGSMQGWRSAMEDAFVVDTALGESCSLFAVFDGHAGELCAKQSRALLPALVRKHTHDTDSTEVNFLAAYHELDTVMRGKLKDDSGTTACSVLLTPKRVICANVGDSRAVLCRASGEAVDLSFDHKPENEEERRRIEAAGGRVESNRVNGQLAMSRAIGDYSYKQQENRAIDDQLVIPTPHVLSEDREAGDKFVVLACDGIFDVLSNQELVDLINAELERDPQQPTVKICETICNACLAPPAPGQGQPARAAGTDNMTIIIVKFLS